MTARARQTQWIATDMFSGRQVIVMGSSIKQARHREIVARLANLCGMTPPERTGEGVPDWTRLTKPEAGMLNRAAKYLHDKDAADEEIDGFARWFQVDRGRIPMPMDFTTNWTRYRNGIATRIPKLERPNPLIEAMNGDDRSRTKNGN